MGRRWFSFTIAYQSRCSGKFIDIDYMQPQLGSQAQLGSQPQVGSQQPWR